MGRPFEITQERRLQPQQHRVYKNTKTMAPTRNTYSLRSKGLPPMVADNEENEDNEELDGIEVQVPPKAAIDTSQPLIAALTSQVMQLSTILEEQRRAFTTALEEQRLAFARQYEALQTELTNLKADIATSISTQLSNVYVPAPATRSSYATVARSSATLPPNLTPTSTTRLSISEIPYCTIDTSGVDENKQQDVQPGAIREAIEKEIRTKEGSLWRCAAVMRDPRNTARIRVACRDEKEQKAVKEAAEKAKVQGTRVLRDQLFPVKVDGVNRCAILDESNQLRPEIAEKLGKENEVQIVKMAWLSKKDNQKAYRSMVIYVTKGSHARRLLQDQFFHVAGESGWTSVFKPFSGPTQCYNCQEIGHKAFNCKKTQVCAKCAKEGHHHKDCIDNAIPKCVPCGGTHESFSRSCNVLHPRSNE
jgi:Zinc knuckle